MAPEERTVLFSLRAGVPEGRSRELLTEVAAWPEVGAAGPLFAETTTEALRRAYVVALVTGSDAAEVVRRLNDLVEVESASVPAPRHLLT